MGEAVFGLGGGDAARGLSENGADAPAEPADIAYAVLYLALDEATFVSGAELCSGGGMDAL